MRRFVVQVLFIISIGLLILSGYSPPSSLASSSSAYVLIDDFAGVSVPGKDWYYSRIGTDRGGMGDGAYSVSLGGGSANLNVTSGWSGVWTSLIHTAVTNDELDCQHILGSNILNQFQPQVTGLKLHVLDGQGRLKIEIKNYSGQIVYSNAYSLTGGEVTLEANFILQSKIKFLNIILDGSGFVNYDKVWLKLHNSYRNIFETAFLYSYGHLTQCHDRASGLIRDNACWPEESFANIPSIGTYALVTSIAFKLGYVNASDANVIIQGAKNKILSLPTYHGLLPHFMTNGAITQNTEWSSIDTIICLISAILACQSMNISATELEVMVRDIDWNDLTASNTKPISHGYSYSGTLLNSGWDSFGSETFLAAIAYAAATGITPIITNSAPPTWNGSGFNDELAALFFPMNFTDEWGNNWTTFRNNAANGQIQNFLTPHRYSQYSLFGLSASEVPEPWTVAESLVYDAWGMGGRAAQNDGSAVVGYPIIAPHYAALIAHDYPTQAESLFNTLISNLQIFSPLNNVESLGFDDQNQLHWNSLKGAWNLSLQILGLGKALSGSNYVTYDALQQNSFLRNAYNLLHQ